MQQKKPGAVWKKIVTKERSEGSVSLTSRVIQLAWEFISVCFFSTHQTPRKVFQISFPNFPDWNWGLHLLGFFILRHSSESCLISFNLPACCASPSSPVPSPRPREVRKYRGHASDRSSSKLQLIPAPLPAGHSPFSEAWPSPWLFTAVKSSTCFPKASSHYSSG